MPLLADVVGELAQPEQVVGLVESDAVLETEPVARQDLLADALEARIAQARGACQGGH